MRRPTNTTLPRTCRKALQLFPLDPIYNKYIARPSRATRLMLEASALLAAPLKGDGVAVADVVRAVVPTEAAVLARTVVLFAGIGTKTGTEEATLVEDTMTGTEDATEELNLVVERMGTTTGNDEATLVEETITGIEESVVEDNFVVERTGTTTGIEEATFVEETMTGIEERVVEESFVVERMGTTTGTEEATLVEETMTGIEDRVVDDNLVVETATVVFAGLVEELTTGTEVMTADVTVHGQLDFKPRVSIPYLEGLMEC